MTKKFWILAVFGLLLSGSVVGMERKQRGPSEDEIEACLRNCCFCCCSCAAKALRGFVGKAAGCFKGIGWFCKKAWEEGKEMEKE